MVLMELARHLAQKPVLIANVHPEVVAEAAASKSVVVATRESSGSEAAVESTDFELVAEESRKVLL